jgi:hypothetical protein
MFTALFSGCNRGNRSSTLLPALSITLLAGVLSANAQIHTISEGNASADINVGAQPGMFNWSIAGQDQLNQQWFWYRVGLSPEASINTISAPTVTTYNGTRGLQTTYANAQFSVRIDYLISGGLLAGTKSIIAEEITINNLSGAPLPFHFFQYSDFNLGGIPGGDNVVVGPPNLLTGKYNVVDQFKPGFILQEAVVTPGADRTEVSLIPGTLNKLNDGNADILNNVTGPAGPGNVSWAFQWDYLIPVGGTEVISKNKYIQLNVIPEPTSLALVAVGGLLLAARKSRKN